MNQRITAIRRSANLTQEKFAEKIGLTRNFVWMIEKGERVPSDRTISDICREFGVDEHWLRTGEGEMIVNIDKSKKIAAFLGDLMRKESGSFKYQLIDALSEMTPEEWQLIEKLAKKITGNQP